MRDLLKNTDAHKEPSFSLGNRMVRFFWNIACVLLFRYSPRPFHGWRAFLLRLFGAKIGKGCHVYPKVKIWIPSNLTCGDYAGVADDAILYDQAPIFIGEKAVISQGAHLCTGTHDYENPKFQLIAKPIRIEKAAWIGAEAFILPGIVIGAGAVIGARSVVTKDISERMVCAGNPCKPIKSRK